MAARRGSSDLRHGAPPGSLGSGPGRLWPRPSSWSGEEMLAIAVVTLAVGAPSSGSASAGSPGGDLGRSMVAGGHRVPVGGGGPVVVQFHGRGHIHGPIQTRRPTTPTTSRPSSSPCDSCGCAAPLPTGSRVTSRRRVVRISGVPLALTAIVVVWRRWAVRTVRLIGLSAVVVAVLSLGSRLVVDGHRTTDPVAVGGLAGLPLLESLLPVRFGIVLDLLRARCWRSSSTGSRPGPAGRQPADATVP